MRQAVNYKPEKKLRFSPQLLLFLLCAVALAVGIILSGTGSGAPEAELTVKEIIALQAQCTMESLGYQLVIEEKGTDYSLRFDGLVSDGRIYGEMEQFDLQIFVEHGRYFVKGAGLFDEWQPAETAELDGLSAFIRDPSELLALLLDSAWIEAKEGPLRLVDGVPCHTYLLDVSPAEMQGFPQILPAAESSSTLSVYLWFGEEDNFLYRMALLPENTGAETSTGASRIFIMMPKLKELPEDLPFADNRLKI